MSIYTSLQWGHRLSAMETRHRPRRSQWCCQTFNGATAFQRWKLPGCASQSHWTLLGFNGATAFRRWKRIGLEPTLAEWVQLQWSHRLSTMETPRRSKGGRPALSRFNGATAFRRWKPAEPRATKPRTRRFNGATAFRRWKQPDPRVVPEARPPASMGPPPFSDGSLLASIARVSHAQGPPPFGDGNPPAPAGPSNSHRRRFNGATAFRRWKRRRRTSRRMWCATASMGPPPFGDGNDAARNVGLGVCEASMGPPPFGDGNGPGHSSMLILLLPASMGPPPFGDGNRIQTVPPGILADLLQWGHRLSAMETAICESLPSYFNVKVRIPTRND